MKKLFSLTIALLFSVLTYAQVNTVQPSIMVVPFTKQGEDIRTILDNSADMRQVMAVIKEAFDKRGFSTIDFVSRLKGVSTAAAFQDDQQADIKSQLVLNSGADIYVVAEININRSTGGNSVRITLTAYDVSTDKSLANKVGDSGQFYTDNIGKLGEKAVDKAMNGFLDTMQQKFQDMMANGRSIMINVAFDENSEYNAASEVGSQGLTLSDELELWMSEHAYKNYYHMQGTTDKTIIFDDVRIPLKDPATGNNYSINRFSIEVLKFFRSLGLQVSRNTIGGKLMIMVK